MKEDEQNKDNQMYEGDCSWRMSIVLTFLNMEIDVEALGRKVY